MNSEDKKKILLVEDEVIIAMMEKQQLEKYGYNVHHITNGEDAIRIALNNDSNYDLFLMDINLGSGIDGTQAAEEILKTKDIPVVFLSSHTEPEIVEKTEKITSYGYVVKNSGIVVLDASIKMAFKLFKSKMNEKIKEKYLQDTNNLISTAFDSSLDCFLILSSKRNSDGIIIDFIIENVNTRTEEMLQINRSELIGKDLCEVLPINRTAGFFDKYKKVVDSGTPIVEEFYLPDTNVPAAWHYHQVVRSRDGVLIIHRDITQQKNYETALRESENRFRHFMNHLPGTGWVVDKELKFILSQGKGLEKIGLKPDQVVGMTLYEFFGINDENHIVIDGHRRALNGETVQYEQTYNNITFNTSLSPLIDENGCIIGVVGLSIDISERKLALTELQEIKDRYNLAIENTEAGVWDWDMINDKVVYSARWKNMFGYEDHEVENSFSGWKNLWHPDDKLRIEKSIDDYLNGITNKYEIIHRCRHKNGEWLWIQTRGDILKDAEGQPVRWVGTNIDITALKLAEKEIKQQLSENEILLKEAYHRIKNNIASIESLLNLQATSTDNIEVKSVLQESISRIQSTRVLYEKLLISNNYQDVSIKNYIDSLIDSLVTVFSESKYIFIERNMVDFTVSSKNAIPIGIIINELMTNVFKYAFKDQKTGNILLEVKKTENHVILTIKDNGVGIDERVDANKSPGFGLTIVKMLAEQLNGTFTMENDNGTRSILKFEI